MNQDDRVFLTQELDKLLANERVRMMDAFVQHGNVSCLKHCESVARGSYALACRLRLRVDRRALIRGALLHDYFLYDWHDPDKGFKWHGFKHPKIACRNAGRDFNLSMIENDIISKHMWPLTVIPPVCREAVIVCLVDKYCSSLETIAGFKYKLKNVFSG